jgi:hypothetical protein
MGHGHGHDMKTTPPLATRRVFTAVSDLPTLSSQRLLDPRHTTIFVCRKVVVMAVLLVALGISLIVLGAIVLLLFPNRPGGVIRFHTVEVGSKGAGLPLIVLGAALSVAAVTFPEAGQGIGASSSSSSSVGGGHPQIPGLDAAPPTDCTGKFFAQNPPTEPAWVRSVELDATDRHVLGVGERQDAEFGLVFSDTLSTPTPRVLGAMKLSRRAGAGFRISGLIDEKTCQPTGLSLASRPGVPAPAALGDYAWVTFRFADTPYVLLLNSASGNTEVMVTLNRRD